MLLRLPSLKGAQLPLLSACRSVGLSTASYTLPRPVYIRSIGAYLPNAPVSNEDLECQIGKLPGGGQAMEMLRDKILALNGIKTRYYAMVGEQPTHLNLDLAANSVQDSLEESDGVSLDDVGMLATGTTMPDVPIPGFANLLHGKLGSKRSVDCLSSAGVCASSTNALKAAVNAVAIGQHSHALVVGSEAASHGLHAKYLKHFMEKDDNLMTGMFLRYMLSDGAGCALLDTKPHPSALSYSVDGFYHHSFAHELPPCMVAGIVSKPGEHLELANIYKFNEDNMEVVLRVQQDVELLKKNIVPKFKEALQHGIAQGALPATGVDWFVPHISSFMFFQDTAEVMKDVYGMEEKNIWTNLSSVGNIGAASMPLLLWGMLKHNPSVKRGDRVLVTIPESGNFSYHFVVLTVV